MQTHPIPKKLHAIWLGRRPLPDASGKNLKRWEELHPGWEMKFWGEQEMIEAIRRWDERRFLETIHLLTSYASRSDILRLLIMKHEGGVYIDGDMEPVKAIDDLVAAAGVTGCFVGWEQNLVRLNNAVIGSCQQHPAVCDALDSLIVHLGDPGTNIKNAAHATGPFYLTEVWKDDSRVIKFPRETFYPYDWCEPWRANNCITPDTYAVHRWDASWIDEIEPRPLPVSWPLGIVLLQAPGVAVADTVRAELAWASHRAQSIPEGSCHYAGSAPWHFDNLEYLPRAIQALRTQRVFFVPWDHVLDRNTMEAHLRLPDDAIGVTASRLYSSKKLFPLQHRRAKAFPFDIFKFHGWDKGAGIHGLDEVQDVFSLPKHVALACLAPNLTREDFSDVVGKTFPPHCRKFAQIMVGRALGIPGMRLSYTYKTKTTRLCAHPVNEVSHPPETFLLPAKV